MKSFFFVITVIFLSVSTQAQTFLVFDEPMSPFCKVMAPLMGLVVVGAIGYAVVKVIKGKDSV